MAQSTSTDRSSDPSPFAWIFAGALAVVGLGGVLAARRAKRSAQQEMATAQEVAAQAPVRAAPGATIEEIEGHPS